MSTESASESASESESESEPDPPPVMLTVWYAPISFNKRTLHLDTQSIWTIDMHKPINSSLSSHTN